MAQSDSAASSNTPCVNGSLDVRVSGFVFESDARVALEIVRDPTSDCIASIVTVQQLELIDARGNLVKRSTYDPSVTIDNWLGEIQLSDSEDQPLALGNYDLMVTTSTGSFAAQIEVVDATRFNELGPYTVTATVCGLSLQIYRLVCEDDGDTYLSLRLGDRLLVVLQGNPTTGYQWSNTLLYEFATLRAIGEFEFRPDSALIGASGRFLFRYETIAVGPHAFRFVYQRPWESVDPLKIFEFSVDVH